VTIERVTMCTPRSIIITLFIPVAFCTGKCFAQSEKFFRRDTGEIAGNWAGSSLCQVKNSPCRDETVEYNILRGDSGIYHVTMNKIVNGKTDFMAIVDCFYDESTKTLSSSENGKIWQFTMNRKNIDGILIWRNQLYRKIHLEKK